jgi:hypothetical protein
LLLIAQISHVGAPQSLSGAQIPCYRMSIRRTATRPRPHSFSRSLIGRLAGHLARRWSLNRNIT